MNELIYAGILAIFWQGAPVTEAADTVDARATECVVFLHGLARTPSSMSRIAEAFRQQGFAIANEGYPSRQASVEELAPIAVERGLAACPEQGSVHFVTHSLGGILVRQYLATHELSRLGRVVMLAPPNQGSEVVDDFRDVPGFEAINGPAGMQLGTDGDGVPAKLGPVNFSLGVIAGTRTFNPILSQSLPNPDDGKVSVENTKVEGMADFVTVAHSHPFIMQAPVAINYAISFIRYGSFGVSEPDTDASRE